MIEGFENAFTDAQANVISLSLELLEHNNIEADMIYVYMYQNEYELFFNAFVAKEGRIYLLNDLFNDEQVDDYLDCGLDDLDNIIDICNEYDSKCPCEFRLTYNVKTKSFDADYNYEEVITDDLGSVDIFQNWISDCKKTIQK